MFSWWCKSMYHPVTTGGCPTPSLPSSKMSLHIIIFYCVQQWHWRGQCASRGHCTIRAQRVMETWSPRASPSTAKPPHTAEPWEVQSVHTENNSRAPGQKQRLPFLWSCGVFVFYFSQIHKKLGPTITNERFSDCSRISSPSIQFQVQFLRQNYLQSSHPILWVGLTWVFYYRKP